eukprot:scaffold31970_cov31-Tisochrysis_lutea.AAC.6
MSKKPHARATWVRGSKPHRVLGSSVIGVAEHSDKRSKGPERLPQPCSLSPSPGHRGKSPRSHISPRARPTAASLTASLASMATPVGTGLPGMAAAEAESCVGSMMAWAARKKARWKASRDGRKSSLGRASES